MANIVEVFPPFPFLPSRCVQGLHTPYIPYFGTSASQIAVEARNSAPWPFITNPLLSPLAELHSALEDVHQALQQ